MQERGLKLLEAHIRGFDPDRPTARERLEAALGEELARQLLRDVRDLRGRFGDEVERGSSPDLSG